MRSRDPGRVRAGRFAARRHPLDRAAAAGRDLGRHRRAERHGASTPPGSRSTAARRSIPNETILASVLRGVPLDATALGLRRVGDIADRQVAARCSRRRSRTSTSPGRLLGDITPAQITAGGGNVAAVLSSTGFRRSANGRRRPERSGAQPPSAISARLIYDVTLAAVVLSFVDSNELPWEDLALADAHLELLYPGRSTTTPLNFVSEQARPSRCRAAQSATAAVTLPACFAYRPASSQLTRGTGAATAIADPVASGQTLTLDRPPSRRARQQHAGDHDRLLRPAGLLCRHGDAGRDRSPQTAPARRRFPPRRRSTSSPRRPRAACPRSARPRRAAPASSRSARSRAPPTSTPTA